MKILDTPRSGKCGQTVAFQSRFGLCLRQYVPQKAALTPARERVCAVFGNNSRKWSARLSNEQHDRWVLAGAQVMSHLRLGQKGPLTGQQFWQAISTVRAIVGLPETLEVPARPVFSQSSVGRLVIENGADGVRLYLTVSGELNEDIMVFGQEPCSRGRYKRRNVSYLGLLPPPIAGRSEITRQYKARFGEPRPGQRSSSSPARKKMAGKDWIWKPAPRSPNGHETFKPPPRQQVAILSICTPDVQGMLRGLLRQWLAIPKPVRG
jgi:hypothetical protein